MITRTGRPGIDMDVLKLNIADPTANIRVIELLAIHVEEISVSLHGSQAGDLICVA